MKHIKLLLLLFVISTQAPVSYTHLDVYKRQHPETGRHRGARRTVHDDRAAPHGEETGELACRAVPRRNAHRDRDGLF